MNDYIYMDHAAATPMDGRVLTAMRPYFDDNFYNPSASYAPARAVAKELLAARVRVAHWLGSRPGEVVFTAGGTEANNLAIHGVLRHYPGANVVTSAIEHEAVLRPAERYDNRAVAVDAQGIVQPAAVRAAIDDRTALVSVMYANNEIGTVQPIRDIARIVAGIREERRARGVAMPLYLHTDACQASPYLDLHAARLGVDMLTINGGKMYGPKQVGVLYVKAGLALDPIIQGGGQEYGLRSGTENVAACAGLARALELAQQARPDEARRLQQLQALFIQLVRRQLPEAQINGSLKKRLPNNIHITLPGQDNERLILELESKGILAAAGSACSAASAHADGPSHVLRALGLPDADARSSLRFTMGKSTVESHVRRTVGALQACVSEYQVNRGSR